MRASRETRTHAAPLCWAGRRQVWGASPHALPAVHMLALRSLNLLHLRARPLKACIGGSLMAPRPAKRQRSTVTCSMLDDRCWWLEDGAGAWFDMCHPHRRLPLGPEHLLPPALLLAATLSALLASCARMTRCDALVCKGQMFNAEQQSAHRGNAAVTRDCLSPPACLPACGAEAGECDQAQPRHPEALQAGVRWGALECWWQQRAWVQRAAARWEISRLAPPAHTLAAGHLQPAPRCGGGGGPAAGGCQEGRGGAAAHHQGEPAAAPGLLQQRQ